LLFSLFINIGLIICFKYRKPLEGERLSVYVICVGGRLV
jgi:hypothetical protein